MQQADTEPDKFAKGDPHAPYRYVEQEDSPADLLVDRLLDLLAEPMYGRRVGLMGDSKTVAEAYGLTYPMLMQFTSHELERLQASIARARQDAKIPDKELEDLENRRGL